MDTKKRLSLTFLASAVSRGLLLIRHVFVVPLFIAYWGPECYGNWLVCAAVPTAVALGGLGVGTAANVRIATAIARDDIQHAVTIFATGIFFAVVVWGISITITAGALTSLQNYGLLQLEYINRPITVAVLLTAGAALMSLLSHFEGFWIGLHRAYGFYWIRNGFATAEVAAVSVGLIAGLDPWQLASALMCVSAVFLLIAWRMSNSLLETSLFATPNKNELRQLFRTGPGFQLSLLWGVIYFQGSIVVASCALGPTGAANWGTLRALSRSVAQLLGTISQTAYPEMQVAVAKNDVPKIRKIHASAWKLSVLVGLVSAVGFLAIGPYVYDLWTLKRFATPWAVWPLLAAVIVFNAVWLNSALVYRATNRPWWIYSVATLAAGISVAGMAILAPLHGIVVFAAMAVLFELTMAVLVHRRCLAIIDSLNL